MYFLVDVWYRCETHYYLTPFLFQRTPKRQFRFPTTPALCWTHLDWRKAIKHCILVAPLYQNHSHAIAFQFRQLVPLIVMYLRHEDVKRNIWREMMAGKCHLKGKKYRKDGGNWIVSVNGPFLSLGSNVKLLMCRTWSKCMSLNKGFCSTLDLAHEKFDGTSCRIDELEYKEAPCRNFRLVVLACTGRIATVNRWLWVNLLFTIWSSLAL